MENRIAVSTKIQNQEVQMVVPNNKRSKSFISIRLMAVNEQEMRLQRRSLIDFQN